MGINTTIQFLFEHDKLEPIRSYLVQKCHYQEEIERFEKELLVKYFYKIDADPNIINCHGIHLRIRGEEENGLFCINWWSTVRTKWIYIDDDYYEKDDYGVSLIRKWCYKLLEFKPIDYYFFIDNSDYPLPSEWERLKGYTEDYQIEVMKAIRFYENRLPGIKKEDLPPDLPEIG